MNLLSLFAQMSNDLSTAEATNATAAAVIAGLVLFFALFVIITYIILSVMLARIFKKAGVEGWKAWVPIYNTWITLELGEQKGWWSLVLFIPVVNIVASVFLYIAMYNIGLHLNKDSYFVLWAIFLPIVWYIWLAFDQSTWNKSVTTATSTPTFKNSDTPQTPAV